MTSLHLKALVAAVAVAASGAVLADVTIGVVAPLTGPASGLGIPAGNQVKIWPKESRARSSTSSCSTTRATRPTA